MTYNDRGIGRTTRMLKEALALRADAASLPIVIIGVDEKHARQLLTRMAGLAAESGAAVTRVNHFELLLDTTDKYEFLSYAHPDTPPGADYSHIFVDHYAAWFYYSELGK